MSVTRGPCDEYIDGDKCALWLGHLGNHSASPIMAARDYLKVIEEMNEKAETDPYLHTVLKEVWRDLFPSQWEKKGPRGPDAETRQESDKNCQLSIKEREGIDTIHAFEDFDWHAVWKLSRHSKLTRNELCALLIDKDKLLATVMKESKMPDLDMEKTKAQVLEVLDDWASGEENLPGAYNRLRTLFRGTK